MYHCLIFVGTNCQLKQTRLYNKKGAGQISILDLKNFEAWPTRCIWPRPSGKEGQAHWSYWIRANTHDGPGPTIIWNFAGFKLLSGGWVNKLIVPGSSIKTLLVNPTLHRRGGCLDINPHTPNKWIISVMNKCPEGSLILFINFSGTWSRMILVNIFIEFWICAQKSMHFRFIKKIIFGFVHHIVLVRKIVVN